MEIKNLELYGYGIKGFMLSMIESAMELSNKQVASEVILELISLGKQMLMKPVEVLPGVEEVLLKLQSKYRLIVLTKGDLLDQERKLERSGLIRFFHHVEVLSDKKETNYKKLLDHLEIKTTEFLMIGNSLKSDVLPIVKLGAQAIHVPFHTTWQHEEVTQKEKTNQYLTVKKLNDALQYLN